MMTSTGRHLDETPPGFPTRQASTLICMASLIANVIKASSPRAARKGRTYGRTAPVWGQQKKETCLFDRGVVPHMGIPLPYTWLNPSTRPRVWPRFGSPKGRDPHHDHQGHPTTPQAEQPCHQTRAQRQTPQSQKSGEVTRRASAANGRTTTATCTTGDRQSRRGGGRKVKFSSSDENCAYGGV